MTLRVSANVGFLWAELPLPDRIRAAKAAGFDAVECHFPYADPAADIAAVLEETGLPMLGLNTVLGPEGFFGLAALPGQENLAKAAIDQALDYAAVIGARHINVVPGITERDAASKAAFIGNLTYACDKAAAMGKRIVIEALNPRAVPGAYLSTQEQALAVIEAVGAPNLGLMLDFFHAQIVQGDLESLIRTHIDRIGHVQCAAVHDRGEPDQGEINYPYLFERLEEAGYTGYIGAEYKPRGASVEAGLGWLRAYRGS